MPQDNHLNKLLKQLEESSSEKKLPPVEQWDPDSCGDMDLLIKRDGNWYYQGSPISRKRLVKLFSRVLKKEGEDYFLVTPVEKLGIRVEDVPFLMVRMRLEETEQGSVIVFEDNCDNQVALTSDNPLWINLNSKTGEPSPYINIRGNLNGLIHRNLFYELVDMAEERMIDGEKYLGIVSAGEFFSLGKI